MKTAIHFTDSMMINPTNPITINLIGAGGTGSNMLTVLGRLNHALVALEHPGLFVQVFDDDKVTEANLGRQLFAEAELDQNKAVALINRVNRFFGTNWKAIPKKFNCANLRSLPEHGKANMYISCVDTAEARFEIASILKPLKSKQDYGRNRALYWLDFGNSRYTGQAVLATISTIKQPQLEKFITVADLPFITETYKDLLEQNDENDNLPNCSLAEALTNQDLSINSSLAQLGLSLLWQLFREGMLQNKGFFHNVRDFRTQPLKVA